MTTHPECEGDIARDESAQRKPLGESLEHRAHDKSKRFEVLNSIFEFDSFSEELGATARHQRRMTSAAREADQFHAAPAKPRADRVGTQSREFAESAHPPSRERSLEIVAAI